MTLMAMAISYNWLFQWDYTFLLNVVTKYLYNWYITITVLNLTYRFVIFYWHNYENMHSLITECSPVKSPKHITVVPLTRIDILVKSVPH